MIGATVPSAAMFDVSGMLEAISLFTFGYPLLMAYVWMAGALVFYWRFERHTRGLQTPAIAPGARWPRVSVLVPCYNEGANVDEVITSLMDLDYPDYEVVAVNDGSRDNTGALLDALAARFERLRVVHQGSNQGKAVGLNTAAFAATGELLVGIDGDAVLDSQALRWLARHFIEDARVGAVTGNPRIRTRSTLLGRLQVAEFSSVVGLIKRAQRGLAGRLFTVSGVIVAFRRTALHDIGYWSHDMLTEDIDISWKLQTAGWTIRFEPHALVWILMPETLAGLWKQRLRWAMGGVQVMRKFAWVMARRSQWRMWPVYLEYLASVAWAFLMSVTLLAGLLDMGAGVGVGVGVDTIVPGWAGGVIASTCLLQFLLSLAMDSRYDVRLHRYMGSIIWYPMVFWLITMTTTVWAVPSCLMRRRGQRAVWVSPDRGVQQRGQQRTQDRQSPQEQRPPQVNQAAT